MLKKTFLVMIFMIVPFFAGCKTTTTNVYPVNKIANDPALAQKMVNADINGFYFTLPKTLLNLSIAVTERVKTPGSLAALKNAKNVTKTLNITDQEAKGIIFAKTTEFKIGDVNISSEQVNDYENQYYLEILSGNTNENTLKMTLSEYGNISSTEVSEKDLSVEFAVAALKTTASIAGKVIGAGGSATKNESKYKKEYQEYKKLIEDYTKFISMKNTQYLRISAELYEKIKTAYEAMVKQQHDALFGSVQTNTKIITAQFCPKTGINADTQPIKIADYSDEGFSYSNETDIIFLKKVFSAKEKLQEAKGLWLKIETAPYGTMEGMKQLSKTLCLLAGKPDNCTATPENICSSPPCGLPYRIPAKSVISVVEGSQLINEQLKITTVFKRKEMLVAQRGVVAFLPRTVDGSKSGMTVNLYNDSGALKDLNINTTPLESSTITSSGDAASSVITPFTKSSKLANELAKIQTQEAITAAKLSLKEKAIALEKLNNTTETYSEE